MEEISAQYAALMLLGKPAEIQSLPTGKLVVWPLVKLHAENLRQTRRAHGDSSSSDSAQQSCDSLDYTSDEDHFAPRGQRSQENAPLMSDAVRGRTIVNDVSTNFYFRGEALAFFNLYLYAAVVRTRVLTSAEMAELDSQDEPSTTRRRSAWIRFAPEHPHFECAVQFLASKPQDPCPAFVPRWSERRETEDGTAQNQKANEHAKYFSALFIPISASFRLKLGSENWKHFYGNLKRAASGEVPLTRMIPWPKQCALCSCR